MLFLQAVLPSFLKKGHHKEDDLAPHRERIRSATLYITHNDTYTHTHYFMPSSYPANLYYVYMYRHLVWDLLCSKESPEPLQAATRRLIR